MKTFVRTMCLKNEYSKNVLMNYGFRSIGIVLGFINTKLVLGYLGTTLYGLWVTVTSIISWMSNGDLGIGNGLRNELTLAYGRGNLERQRKLIKTAIVCLSKVSFILYLFFVCISEFLIGMSIIQKDLRVPLYITSFFFCINLILGLGSSIAFSYQKSWMTTFSSSAVVFLSICSVLFLKAVEIDANLILFSIVYGICTTIPNLIIIFVLIYRDKNIFFGQYDKKIKKSILGIGLKFFALQLCGVILYSTDSVIINYLLDPVAVTKYSIISKVYDSGTSLFSILLVALWSAVTYHIASGDYLWINRKIKQLVAIWFGFTIGVIFVSVFFNEIVRIWLYKDAIYFEPELIILFGVYCSLSALSAIFCNVVNGLGQIKLQLVLAIIEAIINIPLSIYFARVCSLGILGVKLATFICQVISAIIIPIQVVLILKNKIVDENIK